MLRGAPPSNRASVRSGREKWALRAAGNVARARAIEGIEERISA